MNLRGQHDPTSWPQPGFQAGEAEDTIGRILEARTPLAALLGSSALSCDLPDAAERLARYRRIVNQVHPERCNDGRAAEAFDRASRAFDALGAGTSSASNAGEAWKAQTAPLASAGRWWCSGNIAELDRLLTYCSTATEELARGGDAAAAAKLRQLVAETAGACEHLDRARSFPRHRLWALRAAAAASDWRALTHQFVDLLLYLRAVHRFCAFERRGFSHPAELEASSSAAAVRDYLRRCLTPTVATPSGQGMGMAGPSAHVDQDVQMGVADLDDDIDPLDAYMASIDCQLREEGAGGGLPPGECPSKPQGTVAASPSSVPGTKVSRTSSSAQSACARGGGAAPSATQSQPIAGTAAFAFVGKAPLPETVAGQPAADGSTAAPLPLGDRLRAAASASASTPPSAASGYKLATGAVVSFEGKTCQEKPDAQPTPGLQEKLFAGMETDDESELEDEPQAKRPGKTPAIVA
eukprot:TRINITY_DN14084_c0_g1_i1.p1 TRINITY_DN14084_c0_g1~~TRINITY_DN14084_c0_g1_i1.p1  ORF type:complete len:468 (-),score=104.53 TRINITY_DN14084_c0_g1_i1:111-1514(-)